MRKFIVSDLHGNGNVYKTIMAYLENINLKEEVILYINGDLIDRGPDSVFMLLDVRNRIENGPFKIEYLAGNHELMMFEYYSKLIKGLNAYNDVWINNGGRRTDKELIKTLEKEEIIDLVNFIGNLKIYKKFEEKIDDKNIVLVHASTPLNVENECDLKVKDDNSVVELCLWTRKYDPFIPFRCRIGNTNYFSIVGHTPNDSKYGFEYDKYENYLNIDGGSSLYVSGLFKCDNVPLVQVNEGFLKILTFNNSNEITYGNYFTGNMVIPLEEKELQREREYLNKNIKLKRLNLKRNGKTEYQD